MPCGGMAGAGITVACAVDAMARAEMRREASMLGALSCDEVVYVWKGVRVMDDELLGERSWALPLPLLYRAGRSRLRTRDWSRDTAQLDVGMAHGRPFWSTSPSWRSYSDAGTMRTPPRTRRSSGSWQTPSLWPDEEGQSTADGQPVRQPMTFTNGGGACIFMEAMYPCICLCCSAAR